MASGLSKRVTTSAAAQPVVPPLAATVAGFVSLAQGLVKKAPPSAAAPAAGKAPGLVKMLPPSLQPPAPAAGMGLIKQLPPGGVAALDAKKDAAAQAGLVQAQSLEFGTLQNEATLGARAARARQKAMGSRAAGAFQGGTVATGSLGLSGSGGRDLLGL